MRRFGKISVVAGVLGASAGLAQAATVYQFNDEGTSARGQAAFNYQYMGDDATIGTPVPVGFSHYQLDDITTKFVLFDYDQTTESGRVDSTNNPLNPYDGAGNGISAFTPTIQMIVFAVDPSSRLPVGPVLGTASVTRTFDVTYTTFDEANGDPELFSETNPGIESVTFDFSSQGVRLPNDFGFAYRVTGGTAADGNIADENNFFTSIFTTESASDPVAIGSTVYGSLLYGNANGGGWIFNDVPAELDNNPATNWSVGSNMPAVVNASLVVPEPASLGLLALGGLAMLKRRRTA